ncbi:MAG: hypothetical protein AAGH65_06555 [Pseudomonadota bacterium]
MHAIRVIVALSKVCLALTVPALWAQEAVTEPSNPAPDAAPLTADGLNERLRLIDDQVQRSGNSWQLTIGERPVLVVCDPASDRMRVMTPVAEAGAIDEALAIRMLQANFDAVLDARYAIGNGLIWSVFIHPLASTRDAELASAIGQVVVAADTFGTTFSSGALMYGGGDSQQEHEELLESLQELLSPSV